MAVDSTLIGTRLASYEIESLIGRGGMAAVYRAFDTKLQRSIAIKVLASAVADQPGFVARFEQEARLLAGLRHPHIVHIYDYGEDQGAAYMVQELLPGPSLAQRIAELKRRDAALSRDEIITVARQIGSALDAAHAAGIIHRDVKPSNILWNAAGALVLADFGVAKALYEERLTQTGIVLGTPIYLSPEQAQGQPLTPSSDIYSLGVVLYELIAGHPPFEGATSIGVALSHVQKSPPSLRRSRPDLPVKAEAVVLRALAKHPARRFASAGALAEALEGAWPNTRMPYTFTTVSMPRGSRVPIPGRSLLPILGIVVALLIGAMGWRAIHPLADQADAAPAIGVPTFAAVDPTGIPTSAASATAPVATAPAVAATSAPMVVPTTPTIPATSAPIAMPATPVAIPAAAPAAAANPPADHPDPQPKPAAPNPPQSAPPKPSTAKHDDPKPPKPKKPEQPKPDKPSDKGKGGGKAK